MFWARPFSVAQPRGWMWSAALAPLSRTKPFCSTAAQCTSKVCAKSCIGVLDVLDMKAAEREASDSSCDLLFTVRYLFSLWMVEICHHRRRKRCLSRKTHLTASLCMLKLPLWELIPLQSKGSDLPPPQFDPLAFHCGLWWECSPLSGTAIHGRMERAP